jgi:hypothetical protein
MANAVEKLFDSVLRKLEPGQTLDWPTLGDPEGEEDLVDEPCDGDDDGLLSPDDEERGLGNFERMAGDRISRQLDDGEKEVIEGGIRRRGFDALAFYKSRRMLSARPFPGRWGIFYLKQGLIFVESQIALEYPGYDKPRKLALNFLREHERFHYRADLQTLLFEATLGRELYMPLRRALRGRLTFLLTIEIFFSFITFKIVSLIKLIESKAAPIYFWGLFSIIIQF